MRASRTTFRAAKLLNGAKKKVMISSQESGFILVNEFGNPPLVLESSKSNYSSALRRGYRVAVPCHKKKEIGPGPLSVVQLSLYLSECRERCVADETDCDRINSTRDVGARYKQVEVGRYEPETGGDCGPEKGFALSLCLYEPGDRQGEEWNGSHVNGSKHNRIHPVFVAKSPKPLGRSHPNVCHRRLERVFS